MRHTISFLEDQIDVLTEAFNGTGKREWVAYLMASRSLTSNETRYIIRELKILNVAEIESNSETHVSIKSESYVKAAAMAARKRQTLFLVHNHPAGNAMFSEQDDIAEKMLTRTMRMRDINAQLGSVLITSTGDKINLKARIWTNFDQCIDVERIRVVGKRFNLYGTQSSHSIPTWTGRQVLAFGSDSQHLLKGLHIGVVGAGGTGSAICEQLIRIGIGEITVIDPQNLGETNVTRMYGTTLKDVGKPKVKLVERLSKRIGLETILHPIHDTVYRQKVMRQLKKCDLVFGCSDDHFGRILLNRLAVWYYIPVIDMAVGIDSIGQEIKSVTGRVNLLLPGTPCLKCAGRIDPEHARAEISKYTNPDEYETLAHEGYIPELNISDPSVIMFTTSIASRALCVFMQLITGFMGDDVRITEIRDIYHDNFVGKGAAHAIEGCYCMDKKYWGAGDSSPFLGLTW